MRFLQRVSFIAACFLSYKCYSQSCVPDIFFHHYQGNAAVYPGGVITTKQNETVVAGSTLKINGDFFDAKDGWIAKYSARGNVLWAKRYFIPGFNSGGFLAIENATDSSYFVTARFSRYLIGLGGAAVELDAAAFLLHLDKFGNLIWMKRISNYVSSAVLSTISRFDDNSFTIASNIFSSGTSRLLLMNIDSTGRERWHKLIFIDSTNLYGHITKKLNNGELLVMGSTYRRGANFPSITNQGYYFMKFNPASGEVLSSKAIYFNRGPSAGINSFDIIRKIIEYVNDTLFLYSSFSEHEVFNPPLPPNVKEGILIKAGINGDFYKADAFYNTQPGCQLVDAKLGIDGTHTLLLDDGYKSIFAKVNNTGQIIHQHAYGGVDGNLKGLKLLDNPPFERILFASRRQVAMMGLMKTEKNGEMSCMESPVQMTTNDVSSFFSTANIQLSFVNTNRFDFEEYRGGIGRAQYPFSQITDCLESCCDNINSDTILTELCNVTQFKLPDNSIIKESGLYYANYVTANNCDSVAFFDVRFSKKPVADLGDNVCFGDSTRIVLKADPGYAQYNWMGTVTSSNTYTVTSPGIYQVSISNKCGTSSDNIQVFRECEFPIFIPSGFTPNNDGLNDVFRYPEQNNNRFISMSIYNRWGQQIFYTKDKSKGWNGYFNNILQPHGAYVYIFRLESLDRKKILKKGTILLLR